MSCAINNFNIITVTETRITKKESLLNNLNLNNHFYEFIPTTNTADDTLLYIPNNHINAVMTQICIKTMDENQLLLKLSTLKNQIILRELFTDIHPWISLSLITVT